MRFFARITATAVFISLLPVVAWAELIYVEGEWGRIRSGPGTEYQILWEAPRYTPLEYLAKYQDWYAVRDHEGDVGWVHEQVVGKGQAAIVTNPTANVRKGPSTDNPIVFKVEQNYLFKVLETKGPWYKVQDTEGDTGWIYNSLVWVSK